ncbi:MAG: Rap1a/Tai family immunity protein [Pseudomonadota bacterium]
MHRKLSKISAVAIASIALSNSTPAHSEEDGITGNWFLENCDQADSTYYEGFCVGYVAGLVENGVRMAFREAYGSLDNILLGETGPESDSHFMAAIGHCIPDGATYGQLLDVATSYMKEHPEIRHWGAAALINGSFTEAFPCPGIN